MYVYAGPNSPLLALVLPGATIYVAEICGRTATSEAKLRGYIYRTK